MSQLVGLFKRGNGFYLRVVLPHGHPLKALFPCGRLVKALRTNSKREAVRAGLQLRAEILRHAAPLPALPGLGLGADAQSQDAPSSTANAPPQPAPALPPSQPCPTHAQLVGANGNSCTIRDVFDKWKASKKPSEDSQNACLRAVVLFEQFQGAGADITRLSRYQGDAFRSWLLTKDATSKTTRDRFTWVKSLLKYAARDLELIPRSPWEGLDIAAKTTARRRPWSEEELLNLFSQPLFIRGELPKEPKAGGAAAYWIPLLGRYTGARLSELAQLQVKDVVMCGQSLAISINDEGDQQRVKTEAGIRVVPLHPELQRLGFAEYVAKVREAGGASLWPALKFRKGKPGGYLSEWFGRYRKSIGIAAEYPDFHCFRHTVRSDLAFAKVDPRVQDDLTGHKSHGSVGTRVYQHVSNVELIDAISRVKVSTGQLTKLSSTFNK